MWQPPENGWLKCNVDGASSLGGHRAGCGGVFKDSIGRWLLGFYLPIEDAGSLAAELRTIQKGLELAWDRQYWRVVVESDAREAIDLI